MSDPTPFDNKERARFEERLEQERTARLAAEALAESRLRELACRQERLELIQTIAVVANDGVILEEVLQTALDAICAYMKWPVGHALRPAEDGTADLLTTGIWHLDDPERFEALRAATESLRFAPGVGLPGRVMDQQEPVWIADVTAETDLARAYVADNLGVRAAFAFPILDGAHVGAVLEFFSDHAEAPNAALLEIIANIGTLLTRVIERERAHHEIRRQFDRLIALRAIDTAIGVSFDLRHVLNLFSDQIIHQLKADAVDVLLLDADAHTLEYSVGRGFRTNSAPRLSLAMGEGYAGKAAAERRVLHLSEMDDAPDDFDLGAFCARESFVSYTAVPLMAKGQVKGVLEIFHRTPFQPDSDWFDFLETLAGQAAMAVDNTALFESLQRSNVELTLAYDATIEGWSHALELRDRETEGHTRRVTAMTLALARRLGMSEAELVHIRRGALLHDIGKMGVPDNILHKPGGLSEEEWEIMRRHPVYAYEMLSPIEFLHPALDIPYGHHESWDGTGYPRGLKGEEIPLAARIFAIVDVWDALCSERAYKQAWPVEKAREHIRKLSGIQFDPRVVEAFLQIIDAASVGIARLSAREAA
jgi:putative nucleotidyltransferase with HDIG domain